MQALTAYGQARDSAIIKWVETVYGPLGLGAVFPPDAPAEVAAIAAATEARQEWASWKWEDRAAVMLRAAELLHQRLGELLKRVRKDDDLHEGAEFIEKFLAAGHGLERADDVLSRGRQAERAGAGNHQRAEGVPDALGPSAVAAKQAESQQAEQAAV